MDYTVVCAWYDVREKENNPYKGDKNDTYFCNMDRYFESAKLLLGKPFPLVIFTEPRFADTFLALRPTEYHSITRIICRDYEELAYYSYLQKYTENHSKNRVLNLNEEKFTPLYKFMVNQKVCFMKEVVELNPFQTSRFAWMDLRLHEIYDMPVEDTTQVMENIPIGKVKLMQMTTTTPYDICGRHDFYSWTRGKCAAGFFGGSREPMLEFCDLCQKEFICALEEDMAPTDEMIYSFVIAYKRELFEPYVGEYCDCLRNLIYPIGSHHLVFSFLQKVFENKYYDYILSITHALRKAYISAKISISNENIDKIWYYRYIALAEEEYNREECREILNEYIAYTDTNVAFLNDMLQIDKDRFS